MNLIELPAGIETRAFALGEHAIDDLPEVLGEFFPGKTAVIVADGNTWDAAGKRANELIKESGYPIRTGMIYGRERLHPDYTISESLAEIFTSGVVPVAVGSGVINDIVKCGLDVMCEKVEEFFTVRYKDKSAALAVNPISVTGEGINGIHGAAEHVSRRLNRLTEIVYPDLPYYDKPAFSSRIALLNTAISDRKKRGVWQRIFNVFGGKKK